MRSGREPEHGRGARREGGIAPGPEARIGRLRVGELDVERLRVRRIDRTDWERPGYVRGPGTRT